MLYSPFLIISLPLIFSCLLACFVYDINIGFFKNTFILFSSLVLLTLIIEGLFSLLKINVKVNAYDIRKNNSQNKYAMAFGFFILVFCMIDLYLRGPILFTNPTSYYTFSPLEKYVRYICIMCWTLIPISLFCTKNKIIRTIFISTAILFPILAVDRNRLFSSFYVIIVSFFIIYKEKIKQNFNYKKFFYTLCSLAVAVGLFMEVFSFVGSKRSSSKIQNFISYDYRPILLKKISQHSKLSHVNADDIPILKVNDFFIRNAPTALIWPMVYSSASIFNFSAIHNIDYRDPDHLNYQLFRAFRSDLPAKAQDLTPLPLPLPNLNVGTEFFPFVLYAGTPLVIFSFFIICIIYFFYIRLLSKFPSSIFLLLGFFKLSYCCIMLGFAPQFFTFTNIVFLILMIFMHTITQSQIFLQWADQLTKEWFTQKIGHYKKLFASIKTQTLTKDS
ncbi:MAG: hypothetical protein K2W92_03385 [Alphaproteobacteria bacterium]|nr:hypothetical protein [Alphaproteobacteria bacterium]